MLPCPSGLSVCGVCVCVCVCVCVFVCVHSCMCVCQYLLIVFLSSSKHTTVHALKKLAFYGRTTATGVLRPRQRAYYAYDYGRTTPTATGVLRLRLRAY